jgi:predicted dehydrogenase
MKSRRTFLIAAGGAIVSSAFQAKAAAGDKVRVAVIGVNGRGQDHIQGIQALPDAEVAVLCDVDRNVLAGRAEAFEKKYGRKVATETDLRKVFERKDVDAVTIATPNHWHSLAAIWACQAGKDVYVEKPASHNVFEGRKLVEAAHKYQRIVQHGVQLRSSTAIQEAIRLLRSGTIGNVYMARGLVFRWRPSIGHSPDEAAPPPHIDYNLWTGPAPMRPFSKRIVHYNWHWHWAYGNGDVGNQGIHETDLCMWGLDVGLPEQVTAMGGKFTFDDDKETPEVLTSVYHYPKQKKIIQFEVRHWCTNREDGAEVGNLFYGTEGYMVIKGYDTFETYLGRKREKGPSGKAGGDHYANFIMAVKSRKTSDQNGPVETAHLSSALAHLGNISHRLGRQLRFDPQTERFVGDKEADAMLTRDYRKPFVVPDKV